jgi:hypothetical protein
MYSWLAQLVTPLLRIIQYPVAGAGDHDASARNKVLKTQDVQRSVTSQRRPWMVTVPIGLESAIACRAPLKEMSAQATAA